MLAVLPLTRKYAGLRSILKEVALLGRSSAFGVTFGAQSFAFFRTTRNWKVQSQMGITTRKSSGGSTISRRSTAHSSSERAAPTVMPVFSLVYHSRELSTTAVVRAASLLSTMRPCTSSGPAAYTPPSHRSPALAWVGWCPGPTASFWVGSA